MIAYEEGAGILRLLAARLLQTDPSSAYRVKVTFNGDEFAFFNSTSS